VQSRRTAVVPGFLLVQHRWDEEEVHLYLIAFGEKEIGVFYKVSKKKSFDFAT
jgi:hypothetical protein